MTTLTRDQIQRLPRAVPVRKPSAPPGPRITATVVHDPASEPAADVEITLTLFDAVDRSRRAVHATSDDEHSAVHWRRGRIIDEYA